MKKWLMVAGFAMVLLMGCQKEDGMDPMETSSELDAVEAYFMEVAFGTEFGGGGSGIIRTWQDDLRIAVHSDSTYPELDVELDRVIAEINDLSQTIALRRVRNGETANFNVFLTDADTYGQFEANAVPDLGSNWGYVYVYWTGAVITRGSMYVDTKRNTDLDCMKHLLREELTQALGLLQDSSTHPESIFYQPWTCGFEYAEIDQAVIALLLSPNISAGDSRSEVRRHFEGN